MTATFEKITIDEGICNGNPTIRGARITVQTILDFLSAGGSIKDILYQYPSLTREDILMRLRFASELMKHSFAIFAV